MKFKTIILTNLLALIFVLSAYAGSGGPTGGGGGGGGTGCVSSGAAILKGDGAGGCANATSGTDYAPAPAATTSILKGDGAGGFLSAVPGMDFAVATSGTAILKGNNAGGFANAGPGTDYAVPPNGSANTPLLNNGTGGFTNGTLSGNTTEIGTIGGSITSGHNAGFSAAGNIVDNGAPGAAPNGSANTPLFNNGSSGFTNGTRSGNTTSVATTSGSLTNAHDAGFDSSGNIVDNGAHPAAPSGSANTPLFNNGSAGFTNGTRSGSTTVVGTTSGSLTSGDCVKFDASGNLIDSGALGCAPATTGSSILKASSGGFANAASGTDYQAPIAGNTLGSHNFANSINTAGTIAGAQPASTDLSDLPIPISSGGTGTNYGPAQVTISIANNGSTGPTIHDLVALTGAPSTATIAAANTTKGIQGICISNCTTTGNAIVQVGGLANCVFDNSTTAGDYAIMSATNDGQCHDNGTSQSTALPTLGTVYATGSSGGTGVQIQIGLPTDSVGSAGGGGVTSPYTIGNPAFYNATNTVAGVPDIIHAGSGSLATATAACPAAGPCDIIADPGQTYTVTNITIGLASYDQTLIVDGATINCNGASGACISLRDTGRLVCTQNSNGTAGKNIQATSSSQYDAIVANVGYAGTAGTHFDMEHCAVYGNTSGTINSGGAIVLVAGVAGYTYISDLLTGNAPTGADTVLFTGLSNGASDNDVLLNGTWITSSEVAVNSLLRFSANSGASGGTVIGATVVAPSVVDAQAADFIQIDGGPNNWPTGIQIIEPYLEIASTSTATVPINITGGYGINITSAFIQKGSGFAGPVPACAVINGTHTDYVHIDGRTVGTLCTTLVSNVNTGYSGPGNSGGFNYTYVNPTNSKPSVFDGGYFNIQKGLELPGGFAGGTIIKPLATPATPTCTCNPAGSSHLFWKVAACDANANAAETAGCSASSAELNCATANEVPLSGTDTCTINWTDNGASKYGISFGTTTGSEAIEGTSQGNFFTSTHTTESAASGTPPAANTTGWLVSNGATSGTVTVKTPLAAGSAILTLPTVNLTLPTAEPGTSGMALTATTAGVTSFTPMPLHLSWGPAMFGNTTAPDFVQHSWKGAIAPAACHFTNLNCINNYHATTCSTGPQFNVFNGTDSTEGTALTCSTSVQSTPGTWSNQAETLVVTSGNVYGIELSTAGGTCLTDIFTVQADLTCP